ncbi:MAG TPA: hypothetical protein DEA69_05200 [Microbacterium sp.]|uniref:hypothetical protein n=1 Tax=unclassified Microbacterium TaxID=2609290 RepID=UPI000C56B642|nr:MULTISPECIES: hypothetical protein [unclassified Microbacterium]MBU18809.1 hypothetical protein [Microbacterium sp.]HBS08182.1 hypothetical protein [Microbacterium sp.]HBU43457.1 hypothetical protein [Microbacterium sp.]|tara:strand:+ start:4528 stop:5058 length:531 start_codon:yes stop_codon:yes gene_type:complete
MNEPTTSEEDVEILADDAEPWHVGDEVTVTHAGLSLPWGIPGFGNTVCRRGDVLKVTQDTIKHRQDILHLINSPDAQIERFGEIRILRGRHDIPAWTKQGDAEWILARNAARDLAHQIIDPTERAEALREVSRKFGPGPTTSTSTEIRNVSQQRRLADDAHNRALHGRYVIQSLAE